MLASDKSFMLGDLNRSDRSKTRRRGLQKTLMHRVREGRLRSDKREFNSPATT